MTCRWGRGAPRTGLEEAFRPYRGRVVGVYSRPCNNFQSLENAMDGVHAAYTHRRTVFGGYMVDVGRLQPLLQIDAEETSYGLVEHVSVGSLWTSILYYLMPNAIYLPRLPSYGIAWRVPVDDCSCRNFSVGLTPANDGPAQEMEDTQQCADGATAGLPPASDVAAAILAGSLRLEDVPDRPDLGEMEDHIAQMGQGVIADRTQER